METPLNHRQKKLAERVRTFIETGPNSAFRWPDQTTVSLAAIVRAGTMRVRDKVGSDKSGPERWFEVRLGDRHIVTLVYSHWLDRFLRAAQPES